MSYINGCLEDDLYLEKFTAYVEPAVDDWKLVKNDNILKVKLYDICQVSPILSLKELTLEETCGRGGKASEVNKELE